MSYRKIAELGIGMINKANQHHQMPKSAFDLINIDLEDAVYGVSSSTDRPEHVDFIKELAMKIPHSSLVNAETNDPFVEENLRYEFRNHVKIKVNSNMKIDIDCGNPIFYERSSNATDSRTGSKLVYDKHIKNAVANLSGRFNIRGPYITDDSWFQGGSSQGTFREWLFGPEFGLKTIILLPSGEFDVDEGKTGLVMFDGEYGFAGPITVIDYTTKEEFTADFRKVGYIIPNKELASLLPAISTKTKYKWKKTKIELKFTKDEHENILEGPKEVKGGDIPVLKRLRLGQEPEYYYTTAEHVTDWTDSENERVVTRYQPNTQAKDDSGKRLWYKVAVGTTVKPGTIIPGGMWFTYVNVKKGTGENHLKHLMSTEVTKILKHTRKGKSLHTPQTIWVPYATEFDGWTEDHRKILNEL
jgi:hypothetical protein